MFDITIDYTILTPADLDILKRIYKNIRGNVIVYKNNAILQEISYCRNPLKYVNKQSFCIFLRLTLNYVYSLKIIMIKIEKINNEILFNLYNDWINSIDNCFSSYIFKNKFIQYKFKRPKSSINIDELINVCKLSKTITHILKISNSMLLMTDNKNIFILNIDLTNKNNNINIRFDLNNGFSHLIEPRTDLDDINKSFYKWKIDNYEGPFIN